MKFRVGHGIDIHRYISGDFIMLGGIKIPFTHAVDAHSDGDVVLHAITDALLGALSLGDIGEWFPDSDPELKDIESKNLILPIIMCMRDHGYELNNLDITVIAQAPKIADYKEAIKKSLVELFSVQDSQVNVKATTPEKIGALGRAEGIEAHAILSLIGLEDSAQHTGNHFVLMPDELNDITSEVNEITLEDVDIDLILGADDL